MTPAYRRSLLATSLLVAVSTLPAAAQTAPATPAATPEAAAQAEALEPATPTQTATDQNPQGAAEAPAGEIVVTGSRIASPSATAASPLQSVGIAQIQQAGAINVQDVLLQNPAFGTPGVSRTNSSFATQGAGVATVNLRNLGDDRTLVLVNGRRFVAGLPGSSAVDLNVIPTQFLERVDVLTGGASAVYGSDAVAGVVNMIYKTKFDGIQLDGQVGMSQYGDGFDRQVNALVGKNFADGRGNIMLFGGYSKQGTVLKRDRYTEAGSSAVDSTSRGAYVTDNDADLFTPERPYLSGFAPQGRYYAGDSTFTYGQDGALRNCASANGTAGCVNADGTVAGPDGFNRSDFRYLAVPVERYVAAGRANFEVSPALNLFVEGNYAKTKVSTVIEAFPLDSTFSNPRNSGQIPIETIVGGVLYRNPFVPDAIYNSAIDTPIGNTGQGDGLKDIYFDRRLADFGPRTSRVSRDLFRIAGGANGKFLDDRFNYEVYGVYGQTKEDQVGTGQFNTANFFQALNSYRDPATGQIVCADPAARAAGCVPANIYGAGALAPAAGYLAVPTTLSTKVTQTVAGGNVSGKLFSLFGADPIGFSVGTEYRRESSRNDFDLLTQQGLNGNNALPSTAGRFHLWEGFGEVVAPIIQDKPFFQSLSVRGAIRVSDYSTVGTTYSYNFGGEWAPVEDIRFRVMQARSVRAPNINELFQAPQQNFPSVNDPCIGVTAATAGTLGTTCRAASGVLANIAANGGAFAANQADIQGVTSFEAGNRNLQEEKGDSFTAGVVINPRSVRALRNLVVTVDYFNIRIKDAIVQTPLQYIVNQCYQQGNSDYCSQITRRAAALGPNSAGSLDQLTTSFLNSGGVKTQGIDTVITYRQDLADIGLAGTLGLRGSYTHLISGYTVPLPDADRDYFAGEIGASRDRFTTNLSYDIDGVGFTTTGTWMSQASLDDQLTGARPGTNPLYRVRPQFYLDSQIRFQTNDGFEFYVGGSNLLNNKPPYLADIGASAGQDTDAGTYDPLGRRYYAGVRINF
ncbi:TonB-dependent receptor plug domain-containing protein [Sphingomonas aerolata]|uniref:TonB-dependent receptor plug domain-containing protein n=1 Tax=Sphingomonas aerolata TaxID=185951 RepID=UPI00141BD387|nr:TonB-dependent receptor [Sphingomonas aerolata]NII58901.1 outer membrane receptor protein involved in Fe transport [Sphingomonas aerolata]